MDQLDPTYKFFLEADIVVLVLFLLVLLVGGMVFIAGRWIHYNENALKDKKAGREADNKAKQTDREHEEIRLKMVGELASQIAKLSERISDDREQDRFIREKELKAVGELVDTMDKNTSLLKDHADTSVIFRSTMTTQSTAMLTAIGDANKGISANTEAINSVKAELEEFRGALIALPNTIQSLLNPYCERMENALQKLETVQVEEQYHDQSSQFVSDGNRDDVVGGELDIHPSNFPDARIQGGNTVSSGDGESGTPPGGFSQVTSEDADGNTPPKPNNRSGTDGTGG